MGFGVSPQDVYGSQRRSKQEENDELKRTVALLCKEVQELKRSKQDKEPTTVNEPEIPIPASDSVKDSCTLVSPEVIIITILSIYLANGLSY